MSDVAARFVKRPIVHEPGCDVGGEQRAPFQPLDGKPPKARAMSAAGPFSSHSLICRNRNVGRQSKKGGSRLARRSDHQAMVPKSVRTPKKSSVLRQNGIYHSPTLDFRLRTLDT